MSRSPRWRSTRTARFLGCRITTYAALGAYLNHFSVFIPTMAGSSMLNGLYQTPAVYVNVKGVMTNTVPTDAYRGAGRPEAAYLVERFVDHIAREIGLTPDEIRARNFIKPNQIPFKTALGDTYDSGDFETVMRKGMEKADWKGFAGAPRAVGQGRQVARHRHGDLCREMLGRRPGDGEGACSTTTPRSRSSPATRPTARATRRRCARSPRPGSASMSSSIRPGAGRFATSCPRASPAAAAPSPSTAWRPSGVADKIIAKGKPLAANLLEASATDIDYKDGIVPHRRHRPQRQPVRRRQGQQGRARRRVHAHAGGRHLPQRLPHLRARDRSRHRHARDQELQRDRRFRHGAEPAAAAGPDPRRRRPGRRPGADRAHGLRQGRRASC